MGNFFNQMVMGLKRIPKRGVMEQMRKDYNESLKASTLTTEPEVTPRKKRRVRVNGRLVSR